MKKTGQGLLISSIIAFSAGCLSGMEQESKNEARELNELTQSMHRMMLYSSPSGLLWGHGEISLEQFHNIFINTTQISLGNESVYARLKSLVTNQNDIILREIKKTKNLISLINSSQLDTTYNIVFKKDVDSCLNNLNFISGILLNMALLPLCKYVEGVNSFDETINLLQNRYFSVYSEQIIELIKSMKLVHAEIFDVIDQLLKVAIKKAEGEERERLQKDLEQRQREAQERREAEARALLVAEEERKKAEGNRIKAEKEAERARNAAQAATEENRKRLEAKANQAEETKRKAEAEAAHQEYLAQQAQNMDENAKKQLKKSVAGLENVKALLEKIKQDVANKDFKKLQDDITSVSIPAEIEIEVEIEKHRVKNFPGLLKSLNDYLSDATSGLFIRVFELITGALGEAKENQKSQIFNALKTTIEDAPNFSDLVNKPGIIGSSSPKSGYKRGAVKVEDLIKLISTYKEMCYSTESAAREKNAIENEFFGKAPKDLDEIRIQKFMQPIHVPVSERAPAPLPRPTPPAPNPRPVKADPLKASLLTLKTSLRELSDKMLLLQPKLVALKDRLK